MCFLTIASGSERRRFPVAAASRWHRQTTGVALADACRLFRRGNYMHFYLGHFVDAQRWILVKIRLLDDAVLERDRAMERGREAESDAALHLGADHVGVDRHAAVDGANHSIDSERAIGSDGHFGDLRDNGVERLVHGDAASALFAGLALSQASPSRLCPLRIAAPRDGGACLPAEHWNTTGSAAASALVNERFGRESGGSSDWSATTVPARRSSANGSTEDWEWHTGAMTRLDRASMPSLTIIFSNGVPLRIDCPTCCCHALTLPLPSSAALIVWWYIGR